MTAPMIFAAREALEASLLIGIFAAYLAQTGNRRQLPWVWMGIALAIIASAVAGWALIRAVGGLSGALEGIFKGVVQWAAAGVLTYVVWQMRRQAGPESIPTPTRAQFALGSGLTLAIAALPFFAVFRKGTETFLYLVAVSNTSPGPAVAFGAVMGFGAAATAGYLIYRSLDLRVLFKATKVVLLIFAAGMVAKATFDFQAAGIFTSTISAWDTSQFLVDTRGIGSVLRALVGYSATPSLLQVILWLGYVGLVVSLYFNLGGKGRSGNAEGYLSIPGPGYRHALYRVLRWPPLTLLVPSMMGIALAFLLIAALFSVDIGPFNNQGRLNWGPFVSVENENNLFNFAMWIIWLPLLSIGTMMLGRVWCGNLCPLRLVTDAARGIADRVTGKGSPATPYQRLGWLLPISFIVITFLVKWWPVQQVAQYGAILFLALFGLALFVGFLFRSGTWCRYVCPVGGWLARIARLSPLALHSDTMACSDCRDKPCLKGTAAAGRCPTYLNPSRLESNRHCLKCWKCTINCPPERASLRLGWRLPGAELLKPDAPDLWESLFVASLIGMYVAVGHRSLALAEVSWPVLFFGTISLATLAYVGLCALISPLAGIPFRRSLTTFGYIFLPLEFSTAVIAFGDDALEFFSIAQPAAAALLAVGFVWSVVLAVSVLRNQCRSQGRAIASAIPLGLLLLAILLLWLQWYAAPVVIDVS